MTQIISDSGFELPKEAINYSAWGNIIAGNVAIDIPSDADLNLLSGDLNRFKIIRINFPTFADGRGFTIAKLIRIRGYKGHIRATGYIIPDQYAMARRSGFDDVEISQSLAKRQTESQWLFRANWREHDYQKRLGFNKD
tara:strand:- start:838 stop:1254 length:417 start_codon:yes stop_codon:yes gene_type:complete